MDIIRNFEFELKNQTLMAHERLIVKSLSIGLITNEGAANLLKEIWNE